MKLGRDTNSLSNFMMSGTKGQPTPVVGMGVTILMWTDRHAGTITKVSPSGKTFWFTQDLAERTDDNGLSESQTYTFTPDPNATAQVARLTKKGAYKSGGTQIRLGSRDEYRDFTF